MTTSTPPSKRQAVSAYLRVKTEFGSDFDVSSSPERLLTPVSVQSIHHRESFPTSNWSYRESSSVGSNPSSVSSYQSLEPVTPPYHGHHLSHLPFDLKSSFNNPDMEQTYLGSTFSSPMYTSNASPEDNSLTVTTASEWPIFGHRDNHTFSNMPFNTYTSMNELSSGTTSFSTIMSGRSLPSIEDPHKTMAAYPRSSWSSQGLLDPVSISSSSYRSASFPMNSFMLGHSDLVHSIGGAEKWSMSDKNIGVDKSTITPSQTILDGSSQIIDPSVPELAFSSSGNQNYNTMASYHSPPYHMDQFADADMMVEDEEYSEQFGSQYSPPTWHETSTGGKTVKRKRRGGVPKKRRTKGNTLGATYKGRIVKIPMEKSSASKRYGCDWRGPDGQICGKKFQRVEHLKRHKQTHDGTQYFYCPDPECEKIDRAFRCRNDNLREHFKTHLRQTTTKRNSSRSFEEFYGFIRRGFPAEDAEKYISKLEKWRAEDGHLKTENGIAGRRSERN
jgi:hypothetical protein